MVPGFTEISKRIFLPAVIAAMLAPVALAEEGSVIVEGKPAERVGDASGAQSGSPDVLIGGKPAATLGDTANCTSGSASVFVNGKPLCQ